MRIRRYRCLKELQLDIDDYTAFVGPNGSGKSSVLYALDWFFNGGSLSEDDYHATSGGEEGGEDDEIDVEVTFGDLNDEDRRVLGQYGRGDTVWFRRIWSKAAGKDKMIGNARQGPGFAAIRAEKLVGPIRTLYAEARQQCADLGEATQKESIHAQLDAWEEDIANRDLLVEVNDTDAFHMFGFNGEHVLARRMRFILVSASTDIVGQVLTSGKSNAVSQLIGEFMSEAVTSARTKWEADNSEQLTQLSDAIRSGVEESTKLQAERVNGLLATLVPNAAVEFVPEIPSWSMKGDAFIQTDVVIDGERSDVSRQGHGIQRAVLISMLQALVPDEIAARAAAADDDQEAAEEKLLEELTKLPALVVCIEEPEIYQHPVRARHFARVLSQWAGRPNSQVILATHSPYFLVPEQFGSLRRFRLNGGCSEVSSTTADAVAIAAGVDLAKVERVLAKEIPRTFSEGFFADAVVFVEGDTDRVALEVLSERLGKSLDANGTAILAMGGKTSLKIPFSLLDLIGIPVYIVTDADAQGAARKHSADPAKEAAAAASHKQATDDLLAWLPPAGNALEGTLPFDWGDPTTITERWTIMNDDLEAELDAWPEFSAAIGAQGATLRSKNVAAVRSATIDADLAGLPTILRQLVETVADFG